MNKIDSLKNDLIDTIKNSEEYREYKKIEYIINKDPDLRRQVDEFRRQNFEIVMNDEIMDKTELMEDLNNRFADMRRQKYVNRFLTAEICLCNLVRDVCSSIVDGLDFDVDFL